MQMPKRPLILPDYTGVSMASVLRGLQYEGRLIFRKVEPCWVKDIVLMFLSKLIAQLSCLSTGE